MTSFEECPICLEDFDTNLRCPYIVPTCGHTFCKECLSSTSKLCAICRAPFEAAIKNHALVKLVEINKEAQRWKKVCGTHGRTVKGFCKHCKNSMCSKCVCEHLISHSDDIISNEGIKSEASRITEKVAQLNQKRSQYVDLLEVDRRKFIQNSELFLANYETCMKMRLEEQNNKIRAYKVESKELQLPSPDNIENCISIVDQFDENHLSTYEKKIEDTFKDQLAFLESLKPRDLIIGYEQLSEERHIGIIDTAVRVEKVPDYSNHDTRATKAKLIKFEYDQDESEEKAQDDTYPYIVADGIVYKGQWKDGMRHGKGEQYWPNGESYEGHWEHDKPHGKGRVIFSSGEVYEGDWRNGVRHGKGDQIWLNGFKYSGDWANDHKEGYGKFTYSTGATYTGQVANDNFNGKGVYIFNNGMKYDGQWVNGQKEGQGDFTYANGDKYSGSWKNNFKNGKGIQQNMDGSNYNGYWVNDNIEGQGVYNYSNGEKYEGWFINNLKNGKGKYTFIGNNVYDGYWLNDKREGYGNITNYNGFKQGGLWKDNFLQKPKPAPWTSAINNNHSRGFSHIISAPPIQIIRPPPVKELNYAPK